MLIYTVGIIEREMKTFL